MGELLWLVLMLACMYSPAARLCCVRCVAYDNSRLGGGRRDGCLPDGSRGLAVPVFRAAAWSLRGVWPSGSLNSGFRI